MHCVVFFCAARVQPKTRARVCIINKTTYITHARLVIFQDELKVYRNWNGALLEFLEAVLTDTLELEGAVQKSKGYVKHALRKVQRARKLSGLSKSSDNLLELVNNCQATAHNLDPDRGGGMRDMLQPLSFEDISMPVDNLSFTDSGFRSYSQSTLPAITSDASDLITPPELIENTSSSSLTPPSRPRNSILAHEFALLQINFQKFLERLSSLVGFDVEDVSINDARSLDNLLDRVQEFLQDKATNSTQQQHLKPESRSGSNQHVLDVHHEQPTVESGIDDVVTPEEEDRFIIVEGPFNSDVESKAFTKEDLNRQIDFFEKLLERLTEEDNGNRSP